MKLSLVTVPNLVLTQTTKPIKVVDKKILQTVIEMKRVLNSCRDPEGVGLAAPQVGKSLALCIIKTEGKTYILINPKIKSKSWKKEICEEGCLSFPGKFIPVKRSARVKVEALDRNSKKVILKVEGLLGRAFQHEIDHLNGILYIEKEVK